MDCPSHIGYPVVHVVGAAILRQGTCLVARRGAAMSTPLKWELPGGKVEPGESPRQALAREIREELALSIEVGELLGRGESLTEGRRIVLDVYVATLTRGEVRLVEHHSWGWFSAAEIDDLDCAGGCSGATAQTALQASCTAVLSSGAVTVN